MAVVGWCLGGCRMGVVMWPQVVMMVQKSWRKSEGKLRNGIVWKNPKAKPLLQILRKKNV
ncbi:hypothetical protein F383_05930 [Gossypium arboreum]|uniref:Uncharacterized protein n=1 Tax=Gossypium arboreum TaxID=29729 RepID=A0A0B0PHT8_GOSAR|nr:hypothetical protein F383_05930 [Gossypium arboreum]